MPVRALIIGGTSFMGYQLVWRLLAQGWAVTMLNRGRHADPFGTQVQRVVVDRRTPAFVDALHHGTFDVAVDFACYDRSDAEGAVTALWGRVGHYLFISSGAAYLVREGISLPVARPLSEADYAGRIKDPPAAHDELAQWRYGVGKRQAEAILEAAGRERHFPATRIRLPIVNGLGDPGRRLESYLWRIRDGGPVIIPGSGTLLIRHVYVTDVVEALVKLLGDPACHGKVYNFSQEEDISLAELIRTLASMLGVSTRILSLDARTIVAAGLDPQAISPFSGLWSSRLDASLAKQERGFIHRPVREYLAIMAEGFWSLHEAPASYRSRPLERALAKRLGANSLPEFDPSRPV